MNGVIMMPQISVIVPVYKVEPYLRECLDSVLAQTFSDFELILVDDGSPDHCGTICDYYASQDKRIHVIHQMNKGQSKARNAGLDIATGKYVYFLDSDDYISPKLFETAVSYMNKGNDMVRFCLNKVYEDRISQIDYMQGHFKLDDDESRKQFYIQVLLRYLIGWEACGGFFRRDIIEKAKLRFEDNRIIFAEDLYFTICYCLFVNTIEVIGDHLYYYRQREGSTMSIQDTRLNANRMNNLSKAVFSFFQENHASDNMMEVIPFVLYFAVSKGYIGFKIEKKLKSWQVRKYIIDDIEDKAFFFSMLNRLLAQKNQIKLYMKKPDYLLMIRNTQFWLDGNIALFIARTIRMKAIKYMFAE